MYVGKHVIEYKSKSDVINIIPIGDLHYGNRFCDVDAFNDVVNRLKDKNTYWIGMGDMIDSIITSDPRFDYRAIEVGDIILDFAEELINKLKPYSHKCIGYLTGNHEDKLSKKAHLDISKYIARRLEVPYLGYSALILLLFRRKSHSESLRLFATHGAFNGHKRAGRITRIEDLASFIDADIFLMGHTHDMLFTQDTVFGVNRNGQLTTNQRVYVLTGGFLRGYGGGSDYNYVESKLLKPLAIGSPMIEIQPESKTVRYIQL